ncbi:DUF4124 domain-containing protein [Shewanella sp. 10N.7]|uniref:DUF4124 domain-containing protein n=1 Tax=Shewanella sp. 10N.7 TaxID=2885093 RepID=UPI001E5C554C|nr:DUF4124 domain-containing protein [Shewanella sp. 10N.7]MCC4831746.1 DUF4124 domain-containing protein [Shewanella sp. 10N.7]
MIKLNIKPSLISTSLLIVLSYPVSAEIYKWVDEAGVVHFSQHEPKNLQVEEIDVAVVNNMKTSGSHSSAAGLSQLNCDKAVRNSTKLILADLKSKAKGQSNLFIKTMSSPSFIDDGVKRCNRDKNDPKRAGAWLCQQRAVSASAVKSCEA